MKPFFFLALSLLTGWGVLLAQPNPTPFDLNTGNYSFTQWNSTQAQGTYPANMIFTMSRNIQDPDLAATLDVAYNALYDRNTGTRINGLGTGGFSFINTGSGLASGGDSLYLGAAVLALNSTNRNNLRLTFTAGTVVQNTRDYRIRLQYRTNTNNPFIDVPGPVEYVVNTNGHSQIFGPINLPADCDSQAVVQLRWKYYSNGGSGARPQLRVDDISVTSSGSATFPVLSVTPNAVPGLYSFQGQPSPAFEITVSGTGLTSNISLTAPNAFGLSLTSGGTYTASLNLPNSGGAVPPTPVFVRYQPTGPGPNSGDLNITTPGGLPIALTLNGLVSSATTPSVHLLSTGSYQFTSWSNNEASGSFPTSMNFHYANTIDPVLTDAPLAGNYFCGYNLTTRPRIIGLGTDGILFINTGTPQFDNCASGPTDRNAFLGAAVLALNSLGRNTITISYKAQVVVQGDGTPVKRVYNITPQYRIGGQGGWSDVPNAAFTSLNKDTLTTETFTNIALPADCDNKALVEVRWYYHSVVTGGAGGSRPQIRLDDILVRSSGPPIPEIFVSTNLLPLFNTTSGVPSSVDSFELEGVDLTQNLLVNAPIGFEVSNSPTIGFTNILTLTPTAGQVGPQTVYVRFNPTSTGIQTGNINITSAGATSRVVALTGNALSDQIPSIFINEVVAFNTSSFVDEFGEADDWFEIFNPGNDEVSIAGYYLSDRASNLTLYQIPVTSTTANIPANGFLIVWADDQSAQGDLHTNFSLSQNGEAIFLTFPDGQSIVDSLTFPAIGANVAYGRFPDGGSSLFILSQPTPGANNQYNSVRNLSGDQAWKVFPNPAREWIQWNGFTDVEVFNGLGQRIQRLESVQYIFIKDWANGIYIIKNAEGAQLRVVKY